MKEYDFLSCMTTFETFNIIGVEFQPLPEEQRINEESLSALERVIASCARENERVLSLSESYAAERSTLA